MDPPSFSRYRSIKKKICPDPDPVDCFGTSPVCSFTDGRDNTGLTNKTGETSRNQCPPKTDSGEEGRRVCVRDCVTEQANKDTFNSQTHVTSDSQGRVTV